MLRHVLLSALCFVAFSTEGRTLKIASDDWCPYICDNQEKPGYVVEIIKRVMAKHHINVQFEVMPLGRAFVEVENNRLDMVLALTEVHIKEHALIASDVVIGDYANDFFVLSDNPFRFKNIDQLKNERLGVIESYEYGAYLDAFIRLHPEQIHIAHGRAPLQQNINMLLKGRLSVVLDTKNTVQFFLHQQGISNVLYAGTQGRTAPLYIGFNPQLTDLPVLQQYLSKGLDELRTTSQLKQMLQGYGISYWQLAEPVTLQAP
ncbi:polar amino acid transport system substrate-binding protein [Pseudoalteromonas ulvae UL12]|uniref:substrate-binding periplasmic protein n=1 Tax=Pseudoalteromonas ulvae TaxID=107327 RepID=UPI00186B716A|nr:transporter substrate-binding domain-containing protein [Pseudoalteromonas ulvae]MBE0363439.1 polar amino acid transport system substrate-binding protein [Pseudoalteromonas ulvae UL12]